MCDAVAIDPAEEGDNEPNDPCIMWGRLEVKQELPVAKNQKQTTHFFHLIFGAGILAYFDFYKFCFAKTRKLLELCKMKKQLQFH